LRVAGAIPIVVSTTTTTTSERVLDHFRASRPSLQRRRSMPEAERAGVLAARADLPGLSPSERDILADAANGMTVGETAISRSKSAETVKTQRHAILRKLGARNMVQAVGMAMGERAIAAEQGA
jgi:DNA-binding CsgD family transcriptional regulator